MSEATTKVTKSHRSHLTGVFAPIASPFAEDETLDLDALRHNMSIYAESGIHGYLAAGSNGENRSLTDDEKLALARAVIDHKSPEQVVMVGVAYEAQCHAERFLREVAACGADYALVLPPSYFKKQMSDDVLERFYKTVADGSPIPILLYNAPGFGGMTLSPALVGRLAAHPNIAGCKDSASSGIENLLPFNCDEFAVLAGTIKTVFAAMLGGVPGGTLSLANSFPQVALELYDCGVRKDGQLGESLQAKCLRINKEVSGKYGVSGVKAAMDLAGFRGGIPRRPLLPLTSQQCEEMRTFLAEEGLL